MNESICKELFLIPRERIDLGEGMKTHTQKKGKQGRHHVRESHVGDLPPHGLLSYVNPVLWRRKPSL